MRETIHFSTHFKIVKDGIWILVNEHKHGFTMTDDEGRNWIIAHRRHMGYLNKEVGFWIPSPLIKLPHIFEVKMKGSGLYCHFHYDPKTKNRFVQSNPEVFVGLAAMEVIKDAEHIAKPRSG